MDTQAAFASMDDLGTLEDNFDTLENLEDLEMFDTPRPVPDSADLIEGGVRKRPFCNGFTGCGRINGKRSSLLNKLRLSNPLHDASSQTARAKRPFCNGFYGCGNPGKRIVIRHTYQPLRNAAALLKKRSLCKSTSCLNDAGEITDAWMQSMRTLLNKKA